VWVFCVRCSDVCMMLLEMYQRESINVWVFHVKCILRHIYMCTWDIQVCEYDGSRMYQRESIHVWVFYVRCTHRIHVYVKYQSVWVWW